MRVLVRATPELLVDSDVPLVAVQGCALKRKSSSSCTSAEHARDDLYCRVQVASREQTCVDFEIHEVLDSLRPKNPHLTALLNRSSSSGLCWFAPPAAGRSETSVNS